MGVAGEHLREGANKGATQRVFRQQRRRGVGLFQPFDDGERLGDDGAPILQRRHQTLRVDGEIRGVALFALAQMMRQVLRA